VSPTARILAAAAIALVVVAVGGSYLATHDVTTSLADVIAGREHARWPPPRRAAPGGPGQVVAATASFVLTAIRVGGIAGLVAALLLGANRLRFRRLRQGELETWELALGRDDLTDPFKVQEAFEGIEGSLTGRWYRRLWSGQDHLALEVHRDVAGHITFLAVGTPAVIRVLGAALKELYPDVLLKRRDERPAVPDGTVIRLKKARSHVLSVQITRDYRHAFSESLIAGLDAALGPVVVQLVLTPAPRLLHRRSRGLLKRRERHIKYRGMIDPTDPGTGSVIEAKELQGALESQHRSLAYFDLRVVAAQRADAARIAGLFAQLRAENELVRRDIHVRRTLFARRVADAAPNLIPSLRTGLLSTAELATIWQLPRARVKGIQLNRSTVRRAIGPAEIDRTPANELMRDEQGPVGIAAADRQFGHALIGGQGGGKSSVMARSLLAAANDPDRAIVLFDPKGPLAELALGLLPEHRTVHYLDLAAPEFGFNPLSIDASPGLRASVVVRAMIEANPPGAIQAASDSFLRQAITAVCMVEQRPTFWHVYRMFDFDPNAAYRRRVVAALQRTSGSDFASTYWRREFPALLSNRGFAVAGLNPPRNKIERLISTPELDTLLRHPVALDLAGVVERREVLVVCGAKATLGEDNVVFVMQMLLQLLNRAIQAQQPKPGEQQSRVALFIDEAHNLLTPSVATMLAEGRSAGLEALFAWQYSAQIADEIIRSGLRSLLQSISIFRMREIEDARSLAGLAMEVYADRISADLAEQERLRFSADDIVRLPAHRAINLWIAGGVPRPGFIAESLPMEDLYDQAKADHHQHAQHERGASMPPSLPDPLADWVNGGAEIQQQPRDPGEPQPVGVSNEPDDPSDEPQFVDLEDL